MAGVQGGFGTKIKIKISSVLTAIVHAQDIEFPEFEKILAEYTGHDSPGGYQEILATGKRKMNEIKTKITWDVAETTHAAVLAAFNSDNTVDMSVEDPDSDEIIGFAAHVQKLGRVSKQEEAFYCDVTIQPVGLPIGIS